MSGSNILKFSNSICYLHLSSDIQIAHQRGGVLDNKIKHQI